MLAFTDRAVSFARAALLRFVAQGADDGTGHVCLLENCT
jgi:hypothetical protein